MQSFSYSEQSLLLRYSCTWEKKNTKPDNLNEPCKTTSTDCSSSDEVPDGAHTLLAGAHTAPSSDWLEQLEQMQDLTYSARQTFQMNLNYHSSHLVWGKGHLSEPGSPSLKGFTRLCCFLKTTPWWPIFLWCTMKWIPSEIFLKKTWQQFFVPAKSIFRKRNVLSPIFSRKEQENTEPAEDSKSCTSSWLEMTFPHFHFTWGRLFIPKHRFGFCNQPTNSKILQHMCGTHKSHWCFA